jgi:hypothetical protein
MPYTKRLRALVARGYFPKELPPVFTTTGFGQHVHAILHEWRNSKLFTTNSSGKVPGTKMLKDKSYIYQVAHANIEIISMPKRGYERRNIHITHPIPQALLSYELAKHWKAVQKWLSRRAFSLDDIRLSAIHKRDKFSTSYNQKSLSSSKL